jgi:hypothetical protein
MNPVKANHRTHRTTKLSELRWASYAIAAGATAAGTLATADAAIHYSGPVDFAFHNKNGFATHSFPLSQGVSLVGFRDARGGNGDSSATFEIKGGIVSNGLREYRHSSVYSRVANALPRGSLVSRGYFARFGDITVGRLQDYSCSFPGWVEPGIYYIGFSFDNGAGKQYGWVRIKFAGCGFPGNNRYIVKDYAWGDPGDKIKTGQTQLHEDESQVPPESNRSANAAPAADSLGSLGLLALGAVGLEAWRAKRRE